jgi:hypothetical protein
LEEILELGGATSLLSLFTYKPYGVSHFSKIKNLECIFFFKKKGKFFFELLLAGL